MVRLCKGGSSAANANIRPSHRTTFRNATKLVIAKNKAISRTPSTNRLSDLRDSLDKVVRDANAAADEWPHD